MINIPIVTTAYQDRNPTVDGASRETGKDCVSDIVQIDPKLLASVLISHIANWNCFPLVAHRRVSAQRLHSTLIMNLG